MVTCKLLGRIGNQMFQIAATIGYAKRYGLPYHIPKHTANDIEWPPAFTHLENKDYNKSLPLVKMEERGFHYNHLPAPPSRDCNIELNGYFQSYRYFAHCMDEVRQAFSIPIERKKDYVAIHIRLGDYKEKQDCHPVITKEYVQKALRSISELTGPKKLLILSDEVMLAQKLFFPGFIQEDGGNTKALEDLALGASCDHVIGSNSSFSLWMYYLNQNPDKIGVFPKTWFGPKLPHDTRDLIPKECLII